MPVEQKQCLEWQPPHHHRIEPPSAAQPGQGVFYDLPQGLDEKG